MSERYAEALAELREMVYELRSEAEQCVYGYFYGGDPTTFCPDLECCSEAEMEAHRQACKRWATGDHIPSPGPHEPLVKDGQLVGHVTIAHFGMGTNVVIDERAQDLAERLGRILERLENP